MPKNEKFCNTESRECGGEWGIVLLLPAAIVGSFVLAIAILNAIFGHEPLPSGQQPKPIQLEHNHPIPEENFYPDRA